MLDVRCQGLEKCGFLTILERIGYFFLYKSHDGLQQVTGGIGLPIDSNNPLCPNDRTPLYYTGIYSGRASDVFRCPHCGRHYEHIFYLDQWIYFNP